MIEDNTAFEWMIHIMELSVVIGIAVVTWYVKTSSTRKENQSNKNDRQTLN